MMDKDLEHIVKEVIGRFQNKKPRYSRYSITEDYKERMDYNSIMCDTRNAMNEERGINNNVVNSADRVLKRIIYEIDKSEPKIDKNGLKFFEALFYDSLLDRRIGFIVKIYLLTSEQYRSLQDSFSSYYSNKDSILYINVPIIDGNVRSEDYYGALQHELHHCFQDIIRGGKIFHDGKENLYWIANKMYKDANSSLIEQKIGYAIYLSFKIEQEAYGNTLYAMLIKNKEKPWNYVYKDSTVYQHLTFLKDCINTLSNNRNIADIDNILNKWKLNKENINRNKLIKMCEKAYNLIIKRVGKVISLAKERYNLKEQTLYMN